MKNFINLKDIPTRDLRRILDDAKKRKNKRKKLNTLDVDKDKPLKGKLIIQMYEKQSSRTRLSFHLSIAQTIQVIQSKRVGNLILLIILYKLKFPVAINSYMKKVFLDKLRLSN